MPHVVVSNSAFRPIALLIFLVGSLSLFNAPDILFKYLQPVARAATTFTVNSVGDGADSNTSDSVCNDGAGNCTLRAAVQQANATAGADTINFQLGTGVQTIVLGTSLPDVTDPVVIDGTSQPGYAGTPLVELNGTNAGAVTAALNINAGGSAVRGLVVNRFNGHGIRLASAGGNIVAGNFIGTNAAGTAAQANSGHGVFIDGSPNNNVGGTSAAERNVISGNTLDGVRIFQGSGNQVQGNYIGTDAAGVAAVSNRRDGVNILNSTNNVVGGDTAAARNVISGNASSGVAIDAVAGAPIPVSSGNVIKGNYVGMNAAGTAALPNVASGVFDGGLKTVVGGLTSSPGTAPGNLISGQFNNLDILGTGALVQGNLIGLDVTGTPTLNLFGNNILSAGPNAVIGGTQPGARNVISGGNVGIGITNLGTATLIQGNYIGTDLSGTAARGNSLAGITIDAPGCQIGGASPGAGNVISGNRTGIWLRGTDSTVQGNFIGTDASGASPLPNELDGVYISEAVRSRIGGTEAGAGNRIAFNGGNGIAVGPNLSTHDPIPTGNSLRGNSIFASGRIGIDLNGSPPRIHLINIDGVTLNDAGDTDDGPNRLQNAPAVLSVESSGGATSMRGRLDSGSSQSYDVDLYLNASCDLSGYGEGQTHLGSTVATTDASGVAAFTASFPVAASPGQAVTATATDSAGNTSEFSLCYEVNAPGAFQFISTSFDVDESKGSVSVIVSRTLGTAGGAATVDYATSDGTAAAGADYVHTSGTLHFAPGETTQSFNVILLDDSTDEEDESVRLTLSNPTGGVTLGVGSTSAIQIIDGDPAPGFRVAPATVIEGDAGTTQAVFTFRLATPSGRVVTMDYKTEDGSASAPQDYQPVGGTLVFNPGETFQQVSVTVNGDTEPEADERFSLFVDNVVNGRAFPELPRPVPFVRVSGTIWDEDSPGISFSAPFYAVNETDGAAVIRVVRRGDASTVASASYATEGFIVPPDGADFASARADYTYAAGTLRFAPGEREKSITILVNDDAYVERPEAVALILRSPVNASTTREVQLIIGSDDTQPPTPANNPLDETAFFVRQHYHDFLSREPDPAGLAFWTNEVEQCNADLQCREVKRVNVSAAFFLSIEFQETGYFVYLMHQAAFHTGEHLATSRFLADAGEVRDGLIVGEDGWQAKLAADKQALALAFVQRSEFVFAYPATLTPAQFVDAVNANAGGSLSQAERDARVAELTADNTAAGRAAVLLKLTDDADFRQREFNRTFVLMQYFGYLRRAPNESPDSNFDGHNHWLSKLNEFNGNYIEAELVKAFIMSVEYRRRFGQ